jgi:tRNA pseudouridine55 synthase
MRPSALDAVNSRCDLKTDSVSKMHLNGWVNVYKPEAISSAHLLQRMKHLLPKKWKIGHAGTLDPLACGVLPVALGEATKTVSYAMGHQKMYRFRLVFGQQMSTDDREGVVIAEHSHRPSLLEIKAILPCFLGSILQTPPHYSAIKMNGIRAYSLARENIDFSIAPRHVVIHNLEIKCMADDLSWVEIEVLCGKGTYIRSLARDMALALGTVGYLGYLERTQVGKFTKDTAITLEEWNQIRHNAPALSCLLPVDSVLDDILALTVSDDEALALRQGRSVFVNKPLEDSSVYRVYNADGLLICLGRLEGMLVHPQRVFNLAPLS